MRGKDAKRVAIIEARMKSTRLPGKVLRPIMGRPMLELLVERLQQARNLDQIIVATTNNDSDEPIVSLAQALGVSCHRGSEEDVLDRVLSAARRFEADVVVEVTGDCPLIEATKIDEMLKAYQYMGVDFMANRLDSTYPPGLGMRIFSRAVLEKINSLTQDPVDREHVTLYVWEHPDIFSSIISRTTWIASTGTSALQWTQRMTSRSSRPFSRICTPSIPDSAFMKSSICSKAGPNLWRSIDTLRTSRSDERGWWITFWGG